MINLLKLVNDYRGIGESIVVPNSRKLTNGFEINISKYSGLVSVLKRRSSKKRRKKGNEKRKRPQQPRNRKSGTRKRHCFATTKQTSALVATSNSYPRGGSTATATVGVATEARGVRPGAQSGTWRRGWW